MSTLRPKTDAASLLASVREGDPLAIARAISAVENRTAVGTELAVAVRGRGESCRTLGVTGPPGAGKSSLINTLLQELLTSYRRVGILTVDPSSPISGGAVLGDRVRMAAHSANPGVFIRSLATRGHLGGVTRTTRSVMDLLAAAGMELVIVETVGTGQSEVEVAELTKVKIVVCAPGLGDEMQAIKAGVLEIADLLVVNKADLPDAGRTAAHLRAMLHHRGHDERRSVLSVSTLNGTGLKELVAAIEAAFARPPVINAVSGHLQATTRSRTLADIADTIVEMIRGAADPRVDAIMDDLLRGRLSRHDAGSAIIGVLAEQRGASQSRSVL